MLKYNQLIGAWFEYLRLEINFKIKLTLCNFIILILWKDLASLWSASITTLFGLLLFFESVC